MEVVLKCFRVVTQILPHLCLKKITFSLISSIKHPQRKVTPSDFFSRKEQKMLRLLQNSFFCSSPDFDKIWYADANFDSENGHMSKIRNFTNSI